MEFNEREVPIDPDTGLFERDPITGDLAEKVMNFNSISTFNIDGVEGAAFDTIEDAAEYCGILGQQYGKTGADGKGKACYFRIFGHGGDSGNLYGNTIGIGGTEFANVFNAAGNCVIGSDTVFSTSQCYGSDFASEIHTQLRCQSYESTGPNSTNFLETGDNAGSVTPNTDEGSIENVYGSQDRSCGY